ncbi:hypothetical protein EYF80_004610 [Liparis tanakae]|uniref:Uncharacterized protein n=1 Tax=Liparis tanakae TaxID=230148 RepID=A0A4Z2J511_9TELE|nr:hypothetical protein EYF80_004610 [Liparis tanakae]
MSVGSRLLGDKRIVVDATEGRRKSCDVTTPRSRLTPVVVVAIVFLLSRRGRSPTASAAAEELQRRTRSLDRRRPQRGGGGVGGGRGQGSHIGGHGFVAA